MAVCRNISIAISLALLAWVAHAMWVQAPKSQAHEKAADRDTLVEEKAARETKPSSKIETAVRLPAPPPEAVVESPLTVPSGHSPLSATARIPPSQETSVAYSVMPPLRPRSAPTSAAVDLVKEYAPLKATDPIVARAQETEPTFEPLIQEPAPLTTNLPSDGQSDGSGTPSAPSLRQDTVSVTEAAAKTGGTWLRLLEHGDGPTIEIVWPEGAAAGRLFTMLKSCYGLRLAVSDAQGRLFANVGERGQAWDLNLDRYSGFMRQTGSWLAPGERSELKKINARHGRINGSPVRLLDRRFDSRMLGGLSQMLGPDYLQSQVIRATYQINGESLAVADINVDGRAVTGRIDLTPTSSCGNERGS